MSEPLSFDDLDDGPRHHDEVMAAHPGQPTPAEHVAAGATPASGAGHGDSDDYSA